MALVQSKSGAQNTGLATVSATWDTAATASNLLILIVGADDYAASPPTGWTESIGCKQHTYLGHYLWWKVAAGGETSVNYTIGSAASSCWVTAEISGLISTPYDISAGQLDQSRATTYTTPSITPSAGDRYVIASIGGADSGGSITINTWLNSFTARQDIGTTLGSGTRDVVGYADRAATYNGSTAVSSGATYSTAVQARTGIIIAFTVAPPAVILDQQGYRWRNDDGSETTATWKTAQNTSASIPSATPARLRVLVNATNDPPSQGYQLEHRKVGTTAWKKVT